MSERRHYNAFMHPACMRIRKARLAAGFTLEKVAREMGKGRAWLCRKETGWRRVKGYELEAILKTISRLSALSRQSNQIAKSQETNTILREGETG
jgi:transcriptional regulator with XRE-family HTH domain